MILRRVIQHFRRQEWTAIFLDFVIVVVGVFVGIQVSNWNEARKDAAWERAFLGDMLVEMRENRAQLAGVSTFQTQKNEALNDVRALLDQELTPDRRAEIERKFFFAQSSNKTFFPTKGVYLSALSSGRVDQIDDKAIKYAVMNLYEHYFTRLVYNGEIYDERVDQVTWDVRRLIDSAGERLRSDDAIASEDFRAGIGFLATQSGIYATLARDNLRQTDNVIAALMEELGESGDQ